MKNTNKSASYHKHIVRPPIPIQSTLGVNYRHEHCKKNRPTSIFALIIKSVKCTNHETVQHRFFAAWCYA